jgi:squalene-associated FAD-dependent desaturase
VTSDRVVVVGGGLAGITAAIALAEARVPVTLLEARPWLGGATWSFGRRGLTIDNGQHVFPRCFTAYRDLLTRLGTAGSVRIQNRLDLTVLTQHGPLRLRRTGWPAPLHLARIVAGYRPLTVAERLNIVPAAAALWLSDLSGPSKGDSSIADWLSRHGQGAQARSQFWDMFLVPFLNAASEQADVGTAAAAINAVLLSHRDHADLGVTAVPLRDLHGTPAARVLADLGAEIRIGAEVTAIRSGPDSGYRVHLGHGAAQQQQDQLPLGLEEPDIIAAAGVVLAVPPWAALSLVPAELSEDAARWAGLEPSPVVSLHVMYGSRVTRLPFATAVDSPLRWITDRTRAAGLHAGQYLAATLPAADRYVDTPAASLREEFLPEFERLFPAAAAAGVDDFFVTRERCATFRPAPGSRAVRPDQVTKLRGLALAGAWTDTGWPDTMEGAVRSGHLAAESVLRALRSADSQSMPIEQTRPVAVAVDAVKAAVPVAPADRKLASSADESSADESSAAERAEDKPAVADDSAGPATGHRATATAGEGPAEPGAAGDDEPVAANSAAEATADGPGAAASADGAGAGAGGEEPVAAASADGAEAAAGAEEAGAAAGEDDPAAAARSPAELPPASPPSEPATTTSAAGVPAARRAAGSARLRAAKTGAGTRAPGAGQTTPAPEAAPGRAEAAARP